MKKLNEKIIYGVYYRKSSESEDRQAQSIPDQVRDTDAVIKREKLLVGKKYPGESQSAFKIGRPIFAELVKDALDGKINAILVWHPNRLARNPRDGGMLLWLIDEKILKEIRTPSRVYRNTGSDKFMLQLEFGMSKKDSDDKSEVVKRALEGRAQRGLPNGVAHVGYINDQTKEKGNRGWIKDPIRYPLVKQILTMFLSGKYSVRELHLLAKNKLKLTTPQRNKLGGRPIALSYMYLLLRDPIHAGFFYQESNGERVRYKFDAFESMISEEEYWKIQSMLGSKGKQRMTKREATYHQFTTCGTCNGMLSPDFKFQVICSKCKKKFSHLNKTNCPSCNLAIEKMKAPKFLTYIFYYCINNKKHRTDCANSGIEEKSLEQQLNSYLEQNLVISKELSAWCIDNISKLEDEAIDDAVNVRRNLESERSMLKGKIERLMMLRISSDRTAHENEEFDTIKKKLDEDLAMIELKLVDTDLDWFSEASKNFNLMSEVLNVFQNGKPEQKKDILRAFGSNLTVSAKKLSVTNKKSVEAVKTYLLQARAEDKSFEPAIHQADKGKTPPFGDVHPYWLRG